MVSVRGNRDWKTLKGVRAGLSLRFTIYPTEVDFNENKAVIYCSIFPKSLEGLEETLDRWNINYIKDNLKRLKKDLKDAEDIAEDFYREDDLEAAIANFAEEHDLKISAEELAKKWIRMRMTDCSDKIPSIPLRNEEDPKTFGKEIRLGIEEAEVKFSFGDVHNSNRDVCRTTSSEWV